VVVGLDTTRSALQRSPRSLRFAVSLAALLLVVGQAGEDFLNHKLAPYSRGLWAEPQPGLAAFIARETKPTDRIFTDGPPILYVETNRLSATRESNYTDEIMAAYDGKTDEEKLRPVYDSLVKHRPKVVFLDPESGPRKVRHRNAAILPFLRNYKYKEINPSLFVRPD
jgi:hypothetical protein